MEKAKDSAGTDSSEGVNEVDFLKLVAQEHSRERSATGRTTASSALSLIEASHRLEKGVFDRKGLEHRTPKRREVSQDQTSSSHVGMLHSIDADDKRVIPLPFDHYRQ